MADQGVLVIGFDEEEECMDCDQIIAGGYFSEDGVPEQADHLNELAAVLKGTSCTTVVFTKRAAEKLGHWIDRKNWGQDDEDDPMREGAV